MKRVWSRNRSHSCEDIDEWFSSSFTCDVCNFFPQKKPSKLIRFSPRGEATHFIFPQLCGPKPIFSFFFKEPNRRAIRNKHAEREHFFRLIRTDWVLSMSEVGVWTLPSFLWQNIYKQTGLFWSYINSWKLSKLYFKHTDTLIRNLRACVFSQCSVYSERPHSREVDLAV